MRNTTRTFVAIGMVAVLSMASFGCSSTSSTEEDAETSETEEVSVETPEDTIYVDAEWLLDNIDVVTVVDARGADAYAEGHIPGAYNIGWQTSSNTYVAQGTDGWAEISEEAIGGEIAGYGFEADDVIVVYCEPSEGWGEDGRIMWELGEAGLSNVYLLDGGWSAWTEAGGESETGLSGENVSGIVQVDTDYVIENMDSITLVDARMTEEYSGETTMGEARAGHIPGAVSVPLVSLLAEDGTILSDEEVEAVFEEAGLSTDDSIVVYCTGGVRAAAVAEQLVAHGYTDVSVYTAGYSEWAGDEANDVEL